MKYALFLLLLLPSVLTAQPSLKWQKCLGGRGNDEPGGLIQTRDGGYIMAGETHSSDGDVNSNHGNYDLWVVKMNSEGLIQWQKTYGGSGDDNGGAIIESVDGGYIIASWTNSRDGDLKGIFIRDSTQSDIWILKIDSLGNIKWQKTFGGSKSERATSIVHGGEGQYIVSGVTYSDDGDVKGFHTGSGSDIWIFSVSENGDFGWQKTFGGSNDDVGAIVEIPGGYAIIGTTGSIDGDVLGRSRDTSEEVWLLKLNSNADILWQKTYGGSNYDDGEAVVQTFDHGYIIAGMTRSNDGDVSGIHMPSYYFDCWILKVDSSGKTEWQKCLGGSKGDEAFSVFQTSDSGYIVSASTASGDGDVTGFHGTNDCWIFKLSQKGDLFWQKTLGGSASNGASGSGIMPTADNGFLVETMTWSNDGDVHGLHGDSGNADIWFVQLSPDPSSVKNNFDLTTQSISEYPNPSTGKTSVSYNLEKSSEVRVELFNVLGKSLRTLVNIKEASGIHEHFFDISDLPSGSYFLRIELDGKSVVKAVELIK